MRRYTTAEGYTLVELLIVVAIVGMVAGAIVGVYQVSQGIYTRATALEEAQLGARAGLDRMAGEFRLIGSYWSGACCNPEPAIITAPTATSISFRADVDADTLNAAGQEITLTAPPASDPPSISVNRTTGSSGNAFTAGEWVHVANGAKREVKQIAAYENGTTIPLTAPLASSFPGSLQPETVRSVETITYDLNGTDLRRNGVGIVENVSVLKFTYFLSDGVTLTTDPALIREIQIDLTVCVKQTIASSCQDPDSSLRQMTTRVKPRSLP